MASKICPACGAIVTLSVWTARHLPGCRIASGYVFVTEDGGLARRQTHVHHVLNLDLLDEHGLRSLMGLWPEKTKSRGLMGRRGDFARKLYPGRPRGYLTVANKLYAMAAMRLRGRADLYEKIYRTLPEWARWRRHFANVDKAVLTGKKFRKNPPPKRRGAL